MKKWPKTGLDKCAQGTRIEWKASIRIYDVKQWKYQSGLIYIRATELKNNEKNVTLNSYKVTIFCYAENYYVHSNGCTFTEDLETPQRTDEPRLWIAELIVY